MFPFDDVIMETTEKIAKLPITGRLWGEAPATGGLISQDVGYMESASICWGHHEKGVRIIGLHLPFIPE